MGEMTIRDLIGDTPPDEQCFCQRRPATTWCQHQTRPDDLIRCCEPCRTQALFHKHLRYDGLSLWYDTVEGIRERSAEYVAGKRTSIEREAKSAQHRAEQPLSKCEVTELMEAFDVAVAILTADWPPFQLPTGGNRA